MMNTTHSLFFFFFFFFPYYLFGFFFIIIFIGFLSLSLAVNLSSLTSKRSIAIEHFRLSARATVCFHVKSISHKGGRGV